MAFSKEELKQLRDLLDERLDVKLEAKFAEKLAPVHDRLDSFASQLLKFSEHFTGRIDALERQMNERFEYGSMQLRNFQDKTMEKFDQLFRMESEDIQAAYLDIDKLKKRVRHHGFRLRRLERPT